jgi:RimJ/RimL family protein N-acetyltransferase
VADHVVITERLILRGWRDSDESPLFDICSDLRVMEFLGPPQSLTDVQVAIARRQVHQSTLGHCLWAIELRETEQMIGFCGIQPGPADTPIAGLPEIGWRLAYDQWGKGYAREAAAASLDWYWTNIVSTAIWAITVHNNDRSWGLMKRLGMQRHMDLDFDHPHVPDGSALKRHVTYSVNEPLAIVNY